MMSDLDALREAWGRPEPPSSSAHSSARAALLERAAAPAPRRGRRWTVRLLAVAASAVVIAAGMTAVQTVGGVDDRAPGLTIPAANAQAVLNKAAGVAQGREFVAPRADQWIYLEVRGQYQRPGDGETVTPQTPLKTTVTADWTRADGKVLANFEDGKLVTSPTGGAMPPNDYPTIASLPTDPDALLSWFRERTRRAPWNSTQQDVETDNFRMLSGLLANNLVPPALEAAIYKAMAKIPGVTVNEGARDIEGRPALAVTRVIEGWLSSEILIDPITYTFRGTRDTVVKDHTGYNGVREFKKQDGKWVALSTPDPSRMWTLKAGTVNSRSTRIVIGVVDQPGQKP
ncbi:CU044_5270 family protein [Nonomuraea sp. NPDC000554]|uniref:CU044_5270 family protein n=1 Tax=Nonomuraea sp. NPDC000554 TaxID=3154259 RepID=UPI003331FB21